MIDVKELRASMARKGYTQKQLASEIGLSEQTLTRKIKVGVFGTDEAERIIQILEIRDPSSVFFAKLVTY